uniref:Putative secreted peptide n=1 Tax=Anopheles braziliensis TaxID=58242 RepID=A0A2M3ZST9_9DIPT
MMPWMSSASLLVRFGRTFPISLPEPFRGSSLAPRKDRLLLMWEVTSRWHYGWFRYRAHPYSCWCSLLLPLAAAGAAAPGYHCRSR